MSLRFIDGCSHYATADILRKWTAVGPVGVCAVVPGAGRFGGGALRVDPFGCFLQKTIDAQSTWVIGFALFVPGLPQTTAIIAQLIDGINGPQCDLRINADGTLSVTRNGAVLTGGASTVRVQVGTWNYIEWKATIASSTLASAVQVQLNGAVVLTATTGQSTQSTSNATANTISLSGPSVGSLFCDLYVLDGQGSVNNGVFLGDVRIALLLPNADGDTNAWSVTGAGSNYQAVAEEPPDGDLSYVSSNTASQLDLYTVPNLTSAAAIKGIQTVLDVRKDDAGVRQVAAVVKAGGTVYPGASQNVGTGYGMNCEVRELNPFTGIAWVAADIDAPLQIGIKLIA